MVNGVRDAMSGLYKVEGRCLQVGEGVLGSLSIGRGRDLELGDASTIGSIAATRTGYSGPKTSLGMRGTRR